MMQALHTSLISQMTVTSLGEGRARDSWLRGQRNIECPKGYFSATGSCVEGIA